MQHRGRPGKTARAGDAAQLGGATGLTWSGTGLLLSAGALGGAAGSTLLAAPVLPRLGALAVTVYTCGLARAPSRRFNSSRPSPSWPA
jgi:hypothetical protein